VRSTSPGTGSPSSSKGELEAGAFRDTARAVPLGTILPMLVFLIADGR